MSLDRSESDGLSAAAGKLVQDAARDIDLARACAPDEAAVAYDRAANAFRMLAVYCEHRRDVLARGARWWCV